MNMKIAAGVSAVRSRCLRGTVLRLFFFSRSPLDPPGERELWDPLASLDTRDFGEHVSYRCRGKRCNRNSWIRARPRRTSVHYGREAVFFSSPKIRRGEHDTFIPVLTSNLRFICVFGNERACIVDNQPSDAFQGRFGHLLF